MSKKEKLPKTKEKATKKAIASFFSILIFVIGVTLTILYALLDFFKQPENLIWGKVCLWGGVALIGVGIIGIIVCVALYRKIDRRVEKAKKEQLERIERQAKAEAEGSQVRYIPAHEAAELVTVGKYQTLEEKFAQIGKMDRTQFVIYVARLFSRKGYQVKLTPVIDNHDIDLLVEKMGVVIAVGCLISNRVLCKEDIVRVRDGRLYYNVSSCMALTNMYFDRTALEFAQTERMSLVDRNILAEDFIN